MEVRASIDCAREIRGTQSIVREITPAAAKLLFTRGYTTIEAARAFIGKETEMLHDPFLMADHFLQGH